MISAGKPKEQGRNAVRCSTVFICSFRPVKNACHSGQGLRESRSDWVQGAGSCPEPTEPACTRSQPMANKARRPTVTHLRSHLESHGHQQALPSSKVNTNLALGCWPVLCVLVRQLRQVRSCVRDRGLRCIRTLQQGQQDGDLEEDRWRVSMAWAQPSFQRGTGRRALTTGDVWAAREAQAGRRRTGGRESTVSRTVARRDVGRCRTQWEEGIPRSAPMLDRSSRRRQTRRNWKRPGRMKLDRETCTRKRGQAGLGRLSGIGLSTRDHGRDSRAATSTAV